MKGKTVKIIIIAAVAALLIAAIVLCCIFVPQSKVNKKLNDATLQKANEQAYAATDKIHFMNTGSSDAILLESDGHFAMIDSGEDSDNPRNFPNLELEGYEEKVLAYLKAHAADEYGKVHLDFVLGTHAHSDHIGGFDTIISDPDVTVDCAYLKPYDSDTVRDYEIKNWDNQEVYNQMVNALNAKNVPIIRPDGTPFKLGNYTITIFNTVDPETKRKVGENDHSLGVLVEKNGTRIFLAGDIDNTAGDEKRLAPDIGKIDLLKVGHHSNELSSSYNFIRTLSPATCVITSKHVNMTVLSRIERACHPDFYVTGFRDGVLAVIGDNGKIEYYDHIH